VALSTVSHPLPKPVTMMRQFKQAAFASESECNDVVAQPCFMDSQEKPSHPRPAPGSILAALNMRCSQRQPANQAESRRAGPFVTGLSF
jgi:hypothetical protein